MTDDHYSAEELERVRRRRLIDDARAVVDRLKDAEKKREEVEKLSPTELSRRLIPAAPDDAVARWARDADERERERRAAERELRREARRDRLIRRRCEGAQPTAAVRAGNDWNAWCDGRIAEALDRERDALAEGFGEGVAKLLADERDATMAALRKVRELRIEITKLQSEAIEMRTQLALERGRSTDLLPSTSRRVN